MCVCLFAVVVAVVVIACLFGGGDKERDNVELSKRVQKVKKFLSISIKLFAYVLAVYFDF